MQLWLFLASLYVAGAVFGAWLVMALPESDRQGLWQWVASTIQLPHAWQAGESVADWQQLSIMQLKWFLLIWFCGSTVAGLPIILLIDFFKGVMTGFTIGLFAASAAWKGLVAAVVHLLPVQLLIVPILLGISVSGCVFSMTVIQERFLKRDGPIFPAFWLHTRLGISLAGILLVGCWLQTKYLSGWLNWVWSVWPQLRIFV
jgi:stage II sporulation protein M